jgi:hypothetical protein
MAAGAPFRRSRRFGCAFAVSVALSGLVLREAHADERVDCATAYEQTQRLQQKSELIAALDAADRCARPTCPALLRDDCVKWSAEIRPKLPELLVRVRAADGCEQQAARVEIGGASRKAPDAEAFLVDPGVHEVKVVDPVTKREKTQTINFAQGERRDIDIDFAAAGVTCAEKPAPRATRVPLERVPKVTLIVGSVGGGLVLVGATLGLVGVVKRSDLDECKPSCSTERIDDVRPFFVAGDVVAGCGVLALAAAVVTFFAADRSVVTSSTSRPRIVLGPTGVGASF